MLPTFVIGLREGLEAALIVGIIAAFLRKQGRRDLVRWMLAGVAVALVLCVAAGVALHVFAQDLPQKQQEGLETVIGALAIGMVTYMVVWMRRNSRNLKGQLESMAEQALGGQSGAGRAMVLMAFLAVIREGVETVVFVLAAFNEAGSGSTAGAGLLLGIAVAVALGYGIYRGGVRINLSKFFRATGIVLVLVAAGILVNTLHTAHEAGWLNIGQSSPIDLTWLVEPGTVQASLLTGMLGIQPHPAFIEIVGWLLYLVPIGLYVAWPPGRSAPARLLARGGALFAVLGGAAALVLALVAPATPTERPTTRGGAITAQVTSRDASQAVLRARTQEPVAGRAGALGTLRLRAGGQARHADLDTDVYRATTTGTGAAGRPTTLSLDRISALNGNRLPIGLGGAQTNGTRALPASYRDTVTVTAWLDQRTDRVVDLVWTERVSFSVRAGSGATIALGRPVAAGRVALPAAAVTAAADAARAAHHEVDRRTTLFALAAWCLVLAVAALAVAVGFALAGRRRERAVAHATEPRGSLVRS